MSDLDHIVAAPHRLASEGIGLLSRGEALSAALVLNRPDWLAHMGCTLAEAVERVGAKWPALVPQVARQLADEAAQNANRAEAI